MDDTRPLHSGYLTKNDFLRYQAELAYELPSWRSALGASRVRSAVANPYETDFLLLYQSGKGALPEVRSLFRDTDFQQQGKVV